MRRCVACLFAVLFQALPAAAAPALPRIASMNVCTDQLVLSLADPAQILGLSRYSRDASQSVVAAEGRRFPALSGGAEDVLVLKPDIVIASLFDKRATRDLLKANGLDLAEFSVPETLDEAKAQIREMGAITGHADRASAGIARIDDAIARARALAAGPRYRVLPVSRRGWVSGARSLLGSLLAAAGLVNAAEGLGFGAGGLAPLETIIALQPDFLVVSEASDRAEDEGEAFLLHPALERMYPSAKRIVIPDRLVVCGGVTLADALDRLIGELQRVTR